MGTLGRWGRRPDRVATLDALANGFTRSSGIGNSSRGAPLGVDSRKLIGGETWLGSGTGRRRLAAARGRQAHRPWAPHREFLSASSGLSRQSQQGNEGEARMGRAHGTCQHETRESRRVFQPTVNTPPALFGRLDTHHRSPERLRLPSKPPADGGQENHGGRQRDPEPWARRVAIPTAMRSQALDARGTGDTFRNGTLRSMLYEPELRTD